MIIQSINESTVRIGPAARIPDVLRTLGVDPARVLAEAGLDLDLFCDPDNLISFSARSHLIEKAMRPIRIPAIAAVRIGETE
mgnify:CR=1 FL=1